MTLSLTPIDPPAHGAKTLLPSHGDGALQGEPKGVVVPSDRLRTSSFGTIFSLSDVPDPDKTSHTTLSNTGTGQGGDTTPLDEVNIESPDFTDRQLTQNAENRTPPEIIESDVAFISPQLPQNEQDDAPSSVAKPQHFIGDTAGAVDTTKTTYDSAEMPGDTYPQMSPTGIAKADHIPETQVAALSSTAYNRGFDQAAVHGSQALMTETKPFEMALSQTSHSVAVAPENVKTAQAVAEDVPFAAKSRGAELGAPIAPDGLPRNAAPKVEPGYVGETSHVAQKDKLGQSATVAVPASEQSRGAIPELHVKADSPALSAAQRAAPGHFWQVPGKASQLGLGKNDRGVTAPSVAGAAEHGALTEMVHQSPRSQPEDQFNVRDGAWADVAKRGDKQARAASGSIASAVVPDGAYSKPSQASPTILVPMPLVPDAPVSVEETNLSRLGFQSDIGVAADQRTVSDVFQAGRFDGPGRADLPRHVATQLAEAVQRGAGQDRPIELTLSPAELGRVRISMAPGDGTIIVTVLAERGETLDLMRRHADQLAQEFHDLGYGSAEFSFAQNSGDQGADQGEAAGRAMLPGGDAAAPSDALPNPIQLSTDRIDIRL